MIGFKLRILVWLLVVSEESWVRHVYNGWFRKKDKKREMFGWPAGWWGHYFPVRVVIHLTGCRVFFFFFFEKKGCRVVDLTMKILYHSTVTYNGWTVSSLEF